ncbi:class I SAM-dependent methyltransferase [Streptomyces longwoodensis]|uniref:class I SAM-dependent methyltransferase n=1 Tax=Streptomyces longwoodensis TaxID=68231 RepID=UPI0033DB11D1
MPVLQYMHPVLETARSIGSQGDPYTVSAEFYDILQADEDDRRVRQLYGPTVATARLGVLDVGAGTGRVTLLGLAASGVNVHAVEPARSMRAPLMSRLAALPAQQRARVSVHPGTLGEADLHGIADVAVCHNTIACLAPDARRALWPALRTALVPGGRLLLQLPPARVPAGESVRELPVQRMGEHEYGGRLVTSPAGNRIRTRFDYWVRGTHTATQRHSETFWMWPATPAELLSDLRRHEFDASTAHHDPAVLAVVRRHTR